jgi:regulatory protein YycH of two-component signal transduction system YycFG
VTKRPVGKSKKPDSAKKDDLMLGYELNQTSDSNSQDNVKSQPAKITKFYDAKRSSN